MTAEKSPSMTPVDASSTTPLPEVLQRHLGHDPVLQWLICAGHPLTVESYVNANWLDELPAELEPDQQELLDALAEYEASQRRVADANACPACSAHGEGRRRAFVARTEAGVPRQRNANGLS